jgi:hypothetical protein
VYRDKGITIIKVREDDNIIKNDNVEEEIEEVDVSALQLAAQSQLLIKLHLNSNHGPASVVKIPVKNLIRIGPEEESTEESLSSIASYYNLQHCALKTLFKYAPNQSIPAYAWRNFRLESSLIEEGNRKRFSTDHEFTDILSKASSDSLMDDNEGVILDVHCKFVNDFKGPSPCDSDDIRRLRESATVAADNAVNTMKSWVAKTNEFLNQNHDNLVRKKREAEYVVLPTDDEEQLEKNNYSMKRNASRHSEKGKNQWASRLVKFLFAPELYREEPKPKKYSDLPYADIRNNENYIAAEIIVDTLIETAEMFTSFIFDSKREFSRQESNSQRMWSGPKSNIGVARKPEPAIKQITSPTPSLDGSVLSTGSNSISKSTLFIPTTTTEEDEDDIIMEDGEDQGVEIIFDPQDQHAPAEWRIFFGDEDATTAAAVVCGEDVSLVESPSDDVFSYDSESDEEEEAPSIAESDDLSFAEVSSAGDNKRFGDNSDDDSWAFLDD